MNLRLYLLSGFWTLMLVILLLSPKSEARTMYIGSIPLDPVVHFALFAGFTHFWMSALKKQRRSNYAFRNAAMLVCITGIVLAILLEFLQLALGTGRDFQFSDIICNLLGVYAGWQLFRLIYRSCC